MLKLIDQGLLFTKIDHYWKYSKYRKALGNHIEWIIENIKNSKDGYIREKIKHFIKELGSNFVINRYTSIFTGLNYTSIFTGLRYSLLLEDCPVLKTRS